MKCGFKHSKECTNSCKYFLSCTRKVLEDSNIVNNVTENKVDDAEEQNNFKNYLVEQAGEKKSGQIIKVLHNADELFLDQKIVLISIFEETHEDKLADILKMVKTNKYIRRRFKGSCVLLECGLANLIDFINNENNDEYTVLKEKKTIVKEEPENENTVMVSDNQTYDINEMTILFQQWCVQNNYKIGTINGYGSALNCVNRFNEENKICKKNIYEIIDPAELEVVIENVKNNPNFKSASQAHFIHALKLYVAFLNDKQFSISNGCGESKPDIVHTSSEVEEIYEIIKRCDNVGLYSKQISDTLIMDVQRIEKILDSSPWCIKKGKRYFYNPNEDFLIENCSFMDNTELNSDIDSDGNLQGTEISNDEKMYLLKTDLDGLIKKLKEQKKI